LQRFPPFRLSRSATPGRRQRRRSPSGQRSGEPVGDRGGRLLTAVDGCSRRLHNGVMAEEEREYFRQEGFIDSRGPVRRMRVRWHPDQRLVVLSLWQAGHCTGTFRLPVEDAGRLITVLADSLTDACTAPAERTDPPRWERWITAARRWLRRPPAPPAPPSFTLISGG
jgi:hypothetical protein